MDKPPSLMIHSMHRWARKAVRAYHTSALGRECPIYRVV